MKEGERQVASNLIGIDKSHTARYFFAAKHVDGAVLDYGCGVGYGSRIMAMSGLEVTGFDPDPEAIKYAEDNYSHPSVNYVSILSNYVTFNSVVCLEVIEHVEEPEHVLDEIWLMLKWGGNLIVSTPDERVMPWSEEKYPFHKKHFRQSEFKKLLENADFKIEKKFNQASKFEPVVRPGWGGSYNIAICKKA